MPSTAAVSPEKILRDLRDQWNQLGREQTSLEGVLRACSMTLVVAAESAADAESIHQTVGVLMHDHPSRAIVLCPRDGAELSARVFAECWLPLGSQRQICAEGIEITADPVQYDDLARLLVPLVVPDLPVVLWCRGGRTFLDRSLDPLFPLAQKIVFDTGPARHAPSALAFLRRLRKEGNGVADLAWTRLTAWREGIAHLFDDGLASVSSVSSVRILHCGEKPASGALYLSRWIERAIAQVSVIFEPARGDAPGNGVIQAVIFSADAHQLSIRSTHGATLEVQAGDRIVRSVLPPISDVVLMREELSILDGDPAFERVLS